MTMGMVAIMGLTSCSDEDFQPGPQTSPDSPGVCFIDAQPYYFVGETDEKYIAELELHRNSKLGELTVPLTTLFKDEGLTLPSEAKFKDGEETTAVTIELTKNAGILTRYNFGIAVGESYGDYYADGPGLVQMSSYMVVAQSHTAECVLQDYNDFEIEISPTFTQTINKFGPGDFILKDFLSSGTTVILTVPSLTENSSGIGGRITVSGKYAEWDEDYSAWYMGDDIYYYVDMPDGDFIDELWIYSLSSTNYYFDKKKGKATISLAVYAYFDSGEENYYVLQYTFYPEVDGSNQQSF